MKHLNLAFAGVVAGSLALSAQAGTTEWWSEDFSGYSLDINAMTNAFTKGTWTMAAGDGSTLKASYSNEIACLGGLSAAPENVLALSTEGNDLTFAPTNATAVSGVTVVDADVFFVGSESAPSNLGNDVQFAMFLQVPEDGSANAVMVYVRDQGNAGWVALDGTSNIADKTWHHVQVKIDYSVGTGRSVNVLIDGSDKTPEGGLVIANGATSATGLTSVSFRGTGAVDNFAGGWETDDPASAYSYTAKAFVDGVENATVAAEFNVSGAQSVTVGDPAMFLVPRKVDTTKTITKIVVNDLTGGASNVVYTVTDDGTTFSFTPTGLSAEVAEGNYVLITIDTTGSVAAASALEVWYATPAAPLTGLSKYLGSQVKGEGTAVSPWQIPDLATLKALQAAVASNDVDCIDAYYVQTADIALDAAWPGIGVKNGKDIVTQAAYDAGAFQGTYDGGNHTISNFQMVDGLDYCGLFNSVKGATIKNLKVSYKDGNFAKDMLAANDACGATFVGVAKASTLTNLTSLAGTVSCTKGFGGIVGYLMAGSTVDSCTNNVNLTSTKSNKAGGIAMITQNGTGTAVIRNCQNNGTTTGNPTQKGGIVGYVGVATTIENCEDTAVSDPSFLHHQTGTLTLSGVNKAPAGVKSYTKNATNIDGLLFATVDGDVATFVHNADLALGNTYKVMGPGAAYEFATTGSITFDEALVTPTVTAPGMVLSSSKSGTVTTYTARAAVAQIGTTNYATLVDAVAAAQAGDTVKLLGNVTLDARVEPTVSMTIDLGGNTITRTGTSGNGSAFDVKSGTVVITNGVINCTQDDTEIVADGVYAITSRSGSNVTLADLTITVNSECGACAYPFSGSTMTIESGTYANLTTTPYRYNTAITGMAVNQPNNATQNLVIKGGSFSKYDPQLGDDSGAMTDFTDEGFVAIRDDVSGAWVVQSGYNVTFDANGGTPAPEAQRIVAGGSAAKPTDPTKEGFTFDGWTLAGSAYDFTDDVVADITLVAAWTENTQPDEPPKVDPGTGVADYNTTYGTAVAPIEVTSSAFKVNFVATVPGTYVLMAATTVDGTYAETEVTQEVTASQIGTEDALVTLEDTNTTAPAKFYKIGWTEK